MKIFWFRYKKYDNNDEDSVDLDQTPEIPQKDVTKALLEQIDEIEKVNDQAENITRDIEF